MVMVAIDSASVGSSRLAISSATVFLKKNDSPKSPRRMLPNQMKNCVKIGSSRPRRLRISRDLLGIGVVARDDRRRIARREAQHQEHEHRDDQHHRRGGGEAAQDVAGHR